MATATKTLAKGQKISLVGFGTFLVYQKAARKEEILKPGRKLKYPPGKLSNSRQAKVLKPDHGKVIEWPRVPGAILFL